MHKVAEWAIIGVALVWAGTPWVLMALAWRKWASLRTTGNPLEDLIDDPAFLIGQALATVSCCALIPLYLATIYGGKQSSNEVVGYGLLIALISGFVGVVVLPFASKHAKWLPFVTCVLNTCFVLILVVIEWE